MKRSEVNAILRQAMGFLAEHQFHLPPFAGWTPEQWRLQGPEIQQIVDGHLGWDITDFGLGRFQTCGLTLFTLRNGSLANLSAGQGKVYAEKILVVEVGQVTPLHFHWQKTEDIINRGGGQLVVQLFNSSDRDEPVQSEVTVSLDGRLRRLPAGGTVVLGPGESITLTPRMYHAFWGQGTRVLVGEVSMVNDDQSDNRFHDRVGRFPQIIEDEPPLHLLTLDYPKYYRFAAAM